MPAMQMWYHERESKHREMLMRECVRDDKNKRKTPKPVTSEPELVPCNDAVLALNASRDP